MSCSATISRLHQADSHSCDFLLRPIRFCNRSWSKLGAAFNPLGSRILQIVKRIFLILLTTPFLLPLSALSTGLALIGITLKACSDKPNLVPNRNQGNAPPRRAAYPSFFDTIDPLDPSEEMESKRSSEVDSKRSSDFVFKPESLSVDLFAYIALFIRPRERLRLTEISRSFNHAMNSSARVLWSQYLGDPEYRIWGATRYVLQHLHNRGREIGYKFLAESQQKAAANISPLLQFKTYFQLRADGIVGRQVQFFDLLARLMPGGPVTFSHMPQLTLEDASSIQPDQMPASMIRGKDQRGYTFFAMRLVDNSSERRIALIFRTHGPYERFEQVPNSVWENNRLKLDEQNDFAYVLALIEGTQAQLDNRAPDFNDPKYRRTLQLV